MPCMSWSQTHQTNIYRHQIISLSSECNILNEKSLINPANQEETIESDAEVVVVDIWNIFDINAWDTEMRGLVIITKLTNVDSGQRSTGERVSGVVGGDGDVDSLAAVVEGELHVLLGEGEAEDGWCGWGSAGLLAGEGGVVVQGQGDGGVGHGAGETHHHHHHQDDLADHL